MGASDAPVQQDDESIVRGHTEKHFPQVVLVLTVGYGGSTICSGTYFDKRMVVTAAHCTRSDAIPGQSYVYFGDDYQNDRLSLPTIPDPGQKSDWARVETVVVHPDYQKGVNYPDLAVEFLDRDLPFDPIPLDRHHIGKHDKDGKIVGWGGSKALTPDITQVEGVGVKRSANTKILGSPTEADYHADDPNPGMLDPAIRANLLKTDGKAPHANTCAGDSGGPLLVKEHGRYELAGVGFWTGLSCEDYAIFSRVDEFLDFFDDMSKLNGNQKVVPRLECVETGSDGKKTARFGYKNDNDLTVYVPYGPRNYFPKDASNARPTAFQPGDSPYAFKVPFGNNTKLQWTLAPFYGPLTNVTATGSSPACDSDSQAIICANRCDAEFAAECALDGLNHGKCVTDCVDEAAAFKDYFGCPTEWNAYLKCVADVPPAESNWDCGFPGFPATPKSPNCDQEITDFYVCAGFI